MNKFRVLVAIVMVLTLMSTLMLVPAFADTAVETGEIVDAAVDEHAGHDHAAEGTVDDGWTTLGMSDYIALVVAAVILVAFVVALVLFVPKKTKQR